MPNLLLELIQLGFHGFAFALFYLSFRQFRLISSQEVPGDLNDEQMRFWNNRTKTLLGTLKWFMGFAVLFFILGVGAQIGSGNVRHEITLNVVPNPLPEGAGILKIKKYQTSPDGTVITPDEGFYTLEAVNKDHFFVSVEDLINYFDRKLKTAEMENLESEDSIGE